MSTVAAIGLTLLSSTYRSGGAERLPGACGVILNASPEATGETPAPHQCAFCCLSKSRTLEERTRRGIDPYYRLRKTSTSPAVGMDGWAPKRVTLSAPTAFA